MENNFTPTNLPERIPLSLVRYVQATEVQIEQHLLDIVACGREQQ